MAKTIAEQVREASTEELLEELKRRRAPALQHSSTEEIEEELAERQNVCRLDSPPKLVEK